MNLSESAASLIRQFPEGAVDEFRKQEQLLERFGQVAFGGFGLVVFSAIIGLIYLIVSMMILTGENIPLGVLLTAFVLFAGLALTYVFLRETLNDKKNKAKNKAIESQDDPPMNLAFSDGARFQAVESVVEDTTELLSADQ
ncbi:MAG TPA: hypothetical protein PKD26_05955 [Pyrinomonadaceae bacterium]|nr:hypothetical protein [Pyrinomonadaceae bacterium]